MTTAPRPAPHPRAAPADVAAALARLRGGAPARRHNARTVAALTANPGCTRRAVLDAAGVDKERLAQRVGHPASFGQSRFALSRGVAFEAMLKADGCALLLDVLRTALGPDAVVPEPAGVDHVDLGADADDTLTVRHARTRALLGAAGAGAALVDHPLLTLEVAGNRVYLEPDLLAFGAGGRLHVVEVKSFAVVDGQADAAKVSAAATQAAVYVLALRDLLAGLGHDPAVVPPEVVLVCPENFTLRPVGVRVDVRRQLGVLRRQLGRLTAVADVVTALPASVCFDPDAAPAALTAALGGVAPRYAPECLSVCELAGFCRGEAAGGTAALGRPVREALGGVESAADVLAFAAGTGDPTPEQAEAAALLRTAARLRAEALAAGPPG